MRYGVLLLLSALAGCGLRDVEKACSLGPGISKTPYDGSDLPDGSVALTFSGGPSLHSTEIADFLYANEIRATFFVSGKNAIDERRILEQLKSREHLVGNNSFSGRALTQAVDPVFEVRRTDEVITPFVTGNMFLLRAPESEFDEKLAERLNDEGLRKYVGPVQWDIGDSLQSLPSGAQTIFKVDTDCWAQGIHPTTCAQGYLEQIRAVERGIVLLHDTDEKTLELVKTLIPALRLESFSFVRVDDVPSVRLALEQTGAEPGLAVGGPGCDDYR